MKAPCGGMFRSAHALRKAPIGDGASTGAAPKIGRRAAPRLRLSIPAKLVTLFGTQRCILIDLSKGGAQVGLAEPLSCGEGAFLCVAGFEHFGVVVRSKTDEGGGFIGLEFECPLADEEVIAVRRFSENMEESERRALRNEAREWVSGI